MSKESLDTNTIPVLSDDKLSEELMYWTRVYRAEDKLIGRERDYYKAITKEARKRRILR